MKKLLSVLVILCVATAPTLAFAASPWTEESTYNERIAGKLEFGLKNTLLGWVDLFYEPNKAASEGTNIWSAVGKGLTDTVLNTAVGAIHLATFLLPVDIPIPDNGVQLG